MAFSKWKLDPPSKALSSKERVQWWKFGFYAVFLALLAGYVYRSDHIQIDPDLVLTTTQGEKLSLRDWLGSPVLVTFWASDCPSCLDEMKQLSELHRLYSPKGLKMVGIAMSYDMPSRVLDLAETLPYPNAFDLEGRLAEAFSGIDLIPNTFLIDAHGNIVWHHLGQLDDQAFKLKIEKILAEI